MRSSQSTLTYALDALSRFGHTENLATDQPISDRARPHWANVSEHVRQSGESAILKAAIFLFYFFYKCYFYFWAVHGRRITPGIHRAVGKSDYNFLIFITAASMAGRAFRMTTWPDLTWPLQLGLLKLELRQLHFRYRYTGASRKLPSILPLCHRFYCQTTVRKHFLYQCWTSGYR